MKMGNVVSLTCEKCLYNEIKIIFFFFISIDLSFELIEETKVLKP